MLLVFGNPAIPGDRLALDVAKRLGREYEHVESPFDLLERDVDDATILDVAEGIERVTLITRPGQLRLGRYVSLHDFDMAYFLRLLERLGRLGRVRIIAIPLGYSEEEAAREVERLVESPKTL